MQVSIDKFGRVVLPKAIRDELGLIPGVALRLERTEQGIQLEPVMEQSVLVQKDGVLIHTGTAVGNIDMALRSSREDRMVHLLT